jgi:hypothetical protein
MAQSDMPNQPSQPLAEVVEQLRHGSAEQRADAAESLFNSTAEDEVRTPNDRAAFTTMKCRRKENSCGSMADAYA